MTESDRIVQFKQVKSVLIYLSYIQKSNLEQKDPSDRIWCLAVHLPKIKERFAP